MKQLIFAPIEKKAKKPLATKRKVRKVTVAAGSKTIEHHVRGQRPKVHVTAAPAQAFSGEIARVSAQWGFSLQIGDGEWQMLRIGVELPCMVAELQATKELAIADVIAESYVQKKALIARVGQAYFGEQKKFFSDELVH